MVDFDKLQHQSTAQTQMEGHAKALGGAAQQTLSSVIPDSDLSRSVKEAGAAMQDEGEKETTYAQRRQMAEATIDSGVAKLKSAVGYVTGNQEQQTQANLDAEKAQWEFKQASSDAPVAVPVPSLEGLAGKAQSVVGAVIGDQEMQKEGNWRAEKAAWKDGV